MVQKTKISVCLATGVIMFGGCQINQVLADQEFYQQPAQDYNDGFRRYKTPPVGGWESVFEREQSKLKHEQELKQKSEENLTIKALQETKNTESSSKDYSAQQPGNNWEVTQPQGVTGNNSYANSPQWGANPAYGGTGYGPRGNRGGNFGGPSFSGPWDNGSFGGAPWNGGPWGGGNRHNHNHNHGGMPWNW